MLFCIRKGRTLCLHNSGISKELFPRHSFFLFDLEERGKPLLKSCQKKESFLNKNVMVIIFFR